MQYKPKSIGALHIAPGGLPGRTRIEVEPGIAVSAKTVMHRRPAIPAVLFSTSNNLGPLNGGPIFS